MSVSPTSCYSRYIKNVCSNIYSSSGIPFLNTIVPSYRENLVCTSRNSTFDTIKYCIAINSNVSCIKNTTFFIHQTYGKWCIERPSSLSNKASMFLEDILNNNNNGFKMEELKTITQKPLNLKDFNIGIPISIDVPKDTISTLYANNCIDYIQVRNYGLYHTGRNIADFNVPLFECEQEIRFVQYYENKNIHLLMSIKPKHINNIKKSENSLDISDTYSLPSHLYLGLK